MGRRTTGRRGGGNDIMWKLRSCPKCSGDLYVDYDLNGWYQQCLQCGYMHDLKSVLEIKKEANDSKSEPVLAGHRHRRAPVN